MAARMTTTCALRFRAAAVAKREVAAPREGREKGGNLMTTRYTALLMCDRVLVLHVSRMNVDVVFIGPLIPSNVALACR